MRQGPLARPLSRRQRLFILFAGLTTILLLSQIAVRLNQVAPYAFQSVYRGVGTIVALGAVTPEADGAPATGEVTIEVDLGESGTLTGTWRIPEPYWSDLAVGSRLAVIYQIHKLGTEIRILECGVVALSDDIR